MSFSEGIILPTGGQSLYNYFIPPISVYTLHITRVDKGGINPVNIVLSKHQLPSETSLNVVSLAGQWWPTIRCLPSQPEKFRHHPPASETPFRWHFTDRLMVARFKMFIE